MAELTIGQEIFAARLVQLTGLDASAVRAWVYTKQDGGAEPAELGARWYEDGPSFYEGQPYHNWLNVGVESLEDLALAENGSHHPVWSNPVIAANATAAWLRGEEAVPGCPAAPAALTALLAMRNEPGDVQLEAIRDSGFGCGTFGGSPTTIVDAYDALGGTRSRPPPRHEEEEEDEELEPPQLERHLHVVRAPSPPRDAADAPDGGQTPTPASAELAAPPDAPAAPDEPDDAVVLAGDAADAEPSTPGARGPQAAAEPAPDLPPQGEGVVEVPAARAEGAWGPDAAPDAGLEWASALRGEEAAAPRDVVPWEAQRRMRATVLDNSPGIRERDPAPRRPRPTRVIHAPAAAPEDDRPPPTAPEHGHPGERPGVAVRAGIATAVGLLILAARGRGSR